MQDTSDLYKSILADPNHKVDTRLDIAGVSYREDMLVSMKTEGSIFSNSEPQAGGCVARKIMITIMKPTQKIPTMAKLEPYMRLSDRTRESEWIPKGKFYIDTRQAEDINAQSDAMSIVGYDDMLRAEADCPVSGMDWPAPDIDVIRMIAADMGVGIDPRTIAAVNQGYSIQIPASYSEREVLSGIAAMYGGSFIMSDAGKLLLVRPNGIPKETYYLINNAGKAITFGGVRILV